MELQHAKLLKAMCAYNNGDPKRIQHLVKVHSFAACIGTLEGLDKDTQFILETAALVHDIGIRISEQKYGVCDGKHQEQEGPAEARKLLESLGGYSKEQIDRVCWLVGHHHTYSNIDGLDYQILVEADFLVNIYEDGLSQAATEKITNNIFKTKTGLEIIKTMFE